MKTKENMEIEKDIIEIVKEIRNKSKNFYNGDIVIPIMNYLIPKIDEMVDKSNKEHTKTVLEWLFPVLKLNKGSVFPVSEDILRDTQWKAKELYNELSSPEKKEEWTEAEKHTLADFEKEEVEGWRSDAELRNDIVKAKLEIEKEEPTQEFTKQELKWLQCFTEDSLERYEDNFVTNGSREQWKVLLSKIDKLLKNDR